MCKGVKKVDPKLPLQPLKKVDPKKIKKNKKK